MSLLCVGKVKVERAHAKTWHTMIATESPDLDLLSNSLSKNLEHITFQKRSTSCWKYDRCSEIHGIALKTITVGQPDLKLAMKH